MHPAYGCLPGAAPRVVGGERSGRRPTGGEATARDVRGPSRNLPGRTAHGLRVQSRHPRAGGGACGSQRSTAAEGRRPSRPLRVPRAPHSTITLLARLKNACRAFLEYFKRDGGPQAGGSAAGDVSAPREVPRPPAVCESRSPRPTAPRHAVARSYPLTRVSFTISVLPPLLGRRGRTLRTRTPRPSRTPRRKCR